MRLMEAGAFLIIKLLHHSYGIVFGVGTCMVRESSGLMLGQYFKRRREFVEIVVQAGGGIGITLFSVFYKEAIG
jgi:hypothetical protein